MTDPNPSPETSPSPEPSPGHEPRPGTSPGEGPDSPEAAPARPAAKGSSERWVFLFLFLLIGFNVFIFFGSREGRTRGGGPPPPGRQGAPPPGAQGSPPPPGAQGSPPPPGAQGSPPPPGVQGSPPPPGAGGSPPPPGSEGQGGPRLLAGPELILGLVALKDSREAPLTAEQEKQLAALVARLEEPQKAVRELGEEALSHLTEEQAEWIRMNRGPVKLEGGETEPGMDPVTSAAWRVLKEKAGGGRAPTVEHKVKDLLFFDIMNGVLRLEQGPSNLQLSGAQARALGELVEKANLQRQKENELFDEIYPVLTPAQLSYLEENRDLVRTDVNLVILRYARLSLEK